jgi:hypothetical protein
MLDRAVLAGSVHRLENEQERPSFLRIKLVLHVAHQLDALGKQRVRLVLRIDLAGSAGIDVLEPEFVSLVHAIIVREPDDFLAT